MNLAELEVEAFVVEVEVEASVVEVEMEASAYLRRSCDGGGAAACAAYDCWNHLHCDAWQSWEEEMVGKAWAKILRHRDAWQSGEEEMVGKILRHRHRHRLRPGKQTHS